MTIKTTWDLSQLAKSDDDPKLKSDRQAALQKAEQFTQKWQPRISELSKPTVAKEALDDWESLHRNYGYNSGEGYYFSLRSSLDQLDSTLKSHTRNVGEVSTKLFNQLQFFELHLSQIPVDAQNKLLKSPLLQDYRHYLIRLFSFSAYQLTEPEEKILNLLHTPAHNLWISMTKTFLSKEEKHINIENKPEVKTFFELISLTSSQDKNIRDQAAAHVHHISSKYAEIATEELNAILYHKKISDELRGFTRPDQSRHLSDDIDSRVVDTLIETVSQHFELSHKFYQLKAKLLGVDKLAYHERNVPVGEPEASYPYDQAFNLVNQTFQNLDVEFAQILNQFNDNGQIDVYPRVGKVGGAFCAHDLLIHPTYILLNHTDKLSDVLTLAHEAGHGIHNELARQQQHALNFGTSLATAEVASTFMEDFVLSQLSKQADKNTELALIMAKLNDDVSSIFRQVACYKFEQQLHQEFSQTNYLSTERIGQIFSHHMQAYMGPAVSQDAGSQNWWVYWSHIRSFFYVYSYASGLLISKSLQSLVKQDNSNISKVKKFMAAGQSDSPQNIFASIGVDITSKEFWQSGLDEIHQTIDQANKLAT